MNASNQGSSSSTGGMSPEYQADMMKLLQSFMEPVQSRLDGIQSSVTSLSASVSAAHADLQTVNQRVDVLTRRVDSLQSVQTPLPGSDDEPSRPPSKRPSISPTRRRPSPAPAAPNTSSTSSATFSAPAPTVTTSRPVQSVSTPTYRGNHLPNTVFISMKTTKMYTERVHAMVTEMFKHAFPEGPPQHNILHTHGAHLFKVQFFDRAHSTKFLNYAQSHIPFTDSWGNVIDFYAKIDSPPASSALGKLLSPGFRFLTEQVPAFDAKSFKLSVDKRMGAILIDHRGLAFSLLQARLPNAVGGAPVISEGDIASRLPELVPGLTLEISQQVKAAVVQAANE